MTTLVGAKDTAELRAAQGAPRPAWLLSLLLMVVGTTMTLAGWVLLGSSWIAPDGLIAGGVALVAVAAYARSTLDVITTTTPFMFYTLSPVGGILTVGSSDLLLPSILLMLVVVTVFDPLPSGSSSTGALPLMLLAALVMSGSTAAWALSSPAFDFPRAASDGVKLVTCFSYLVVVVLLARRCGFAAAVRSLRIWGWTASALALGSLVGATGVVEIVPSDGYRSLGFFEDPNLYAGYLLLSLSVLLFLGTVESSWLLPLQGVLVVGGVVTTGSRGGLASLALLLVFAIVLVNSAKLRLALISLSTVVALTAYYALQVSQGGQRLLGVDRLVFASQQVGDDPRLQLWDRAVTLWLSSPLYGIGLGQFERHTVVFGKLSSREVGYVTHNSFLFFLVAFGVVGLAVFLGFLGWMVRRLYTSAALGRSAQHALASGLVVILSQMMLLNLQNLRYVWVYFGLVVGLSGTVSVVRRTPIVEDNGGDQ